MLWPLKINLGSGKDFREDYLNIDISNYWSPDIVANASEPFPEEMRFNTRRFGNITLEHNMFDEIMANDVLEHVPDLIVTMTNCLNLLHIGGVFSINVPYDLSYGAWQDPTHIRAFNERSWLYYTDWFWYIGWRTHRFQLQSLKYVLSPLGEDLQLRGNTMDTIARMPRAVDSMQVVLVKITISAQDAEMLNYYCPRER